MEPILVIVTIASIILVFLWKRPRYGNSLLTNGVPCQCEWWRSRLTMGLAPGQDHQISEAFSYLQSAVAKLNHNRQMGVVTADKLLLHAFKLVDEDALNNLIESAIEREHSFVASCLKDAWPLLSPKVKPGRTFVKLFCQDLKSKKDSCYSLIEEAHSNFESYESIFGSVITMIEELVTQIEKVSDDQVKEKIRKIKSIFDFFAQFKSFSNNVKSLFFKTLIEAGIKRIIALDTEMVGAGYKGCIDMVARVSLVDKNYCIYDKFVKPIRPVTDYRTFVSGVRDIDLADAPDFKTVQKEVADLIRNRILVGHDLGKDLAVLNLEHPEEDIRDTATYPPFRKVLHENPSLKNLSKKFLDRGIQSGEHSSVEDAEAARDLYLKVAEQWEQMLQLRF